MIFLKVDFEIQVEMGEKYNFVAYIKPHIYSIENNSQWKILFSSEFNTNFSILFHINGEMPLILSYFYAHINLFFVFKSGIFSDFCR